MSSEAVVRWYGVNSSLRPMAGSITYPPINFSHYMFWYVGIEQGVISSKLELNFGDVQKCSNCQTK